MRTLVKMVETWVRKGSQVVLNQPSWFSKVLTLACGAVVVSIGAFLALLLLGWTCQDTDRFIIGCAVCGAGGFAWDISSGLMVLGLGLVLVLLAPAVGALLPVVAVVWVLGIAIQHWQIQKGPTT